ncbi:site-specific integrase (plasmid) [Halorarum halophilum]|uniref:Site-specific integrase n=1 Tax=Halorarum halophilum TaxID=2743090 RepID=A0A7D5GZJ8_9EURY|nr:site-specific integrase [Halobaculum halophilum]QLG29609.1 site-specific integrase [Halobaculum halophilum]
MASTDAAGSTGGETAVRRLIDDFLASKEERGSGAYVASASSVLDRFAEWLEARDRTLADLDDERRGPQLMRRYAKHLRRRANAPDGISPTTANTYYAYVSGCLAYGVRDMVLSVNPARTEAAREELPADEGKRSDQQFWTRDQRESLVGHARARAGDAIEADPFGAYPEVRDHALVAVLAFAGVRGAEVLRHRKDDRRGRQGLRWSRVDLDAGTAEVLGKSKTEGKRWQHASLPGPARDALETLRRVQRPPTPEWPVFESSHAPSLWARAREELPEGAVEGAVAERGNIRDVLRAEGIAPPALTTDGGRSVLRRLTDGAGIDLPEDADYLQPHGARRGIGEELYRVDRGLAQDLLRHEELTTTRDHYQHIDAAERTREIDAELERLGE